MQFLASTNRGLEAVAADEVTALVDADAETHRPGMVRFTAERSVVSTLHDRSRTLHRLLLQRARGPCSSLDDIETLAGTLDVTKIFSPDHSFAVRAQRHGDHPFESPDVADVVGQAIVDSYRAAGERPPVDLDDPDVIFRVFVRDEQVRIAVDLTGARSLHRRGYRVREHGASLRPTMAASMLRIAGYEGETRLVDPLCGAGTIPVEAALLATGRSPTPDHQPAVSSVSLFDGEQPTAPAQLRPADGEVCARDHAAEWVEATRENAAAAGVDNQVAVEQQAVENTDLGEGILVTDLPYGIRTDTEGLPSLYRAVCEAIRDAPLERAVLLTTRDDLVDLEPSRTVEIRRGRLEASVLVID